MWKALDADTLLAFEMNGEPLPAGTAFRRGSSCRAGRDLLGQVADSDLTVLDKPFDGFWMKTAYRVPKGVFGPSRFDSQDSEQNAPITAIR